MFVRLSCICTCFLEKTSVKFFMDWVFRTCSWVKDISEKENLFPLTLEVLFLPDHLSDAHCTFVKTGLEAHWSNPLCPIFLRLLCFLGCWLDFCFLYLYPFSEQESHIQISPPPLSVEFNFDSSSSISPRWMVTSSSLCLPWVWFDFYSEKGLAFFEYSMINSEPNFNNE